MAAANGSARVAGGGAPLLLDTTPATRLARPPPRVSMSSALVRSGPAGAARPGGLPALAPLARAHAIPAPHPGPGRPFPHTPQQIVSAKYVARGKPAPDVYLEALRRLGCTDAARALVVEDAGARAQAWHAGLNCRSPDAGRVRRTGIPLRGLASGQRRPNTPIASRPPRTPVNGLRAAKAAGCFAVAVCTSLPAHMLAPHADLVVEHLRDLDLAAVRAPDAAAAGAGRGPAAAAGGAADGAAGGGSA